MFNESGILNKKKNKIILLVIESIFSDTSTNELLYRLELPDIDELTMIYLEREAQIDNNESRENLGIKIIFFSFTS